MGPATALRTQGCHAAVSGVGGTYLAAAHLHVCQERVVYARAEGMRAVHFGNLIVTLCAVLGRIVVVEAARSFG